MDNFRIIYKVLKILEASMDVEEFDKQSISPERFKLSEARWARLLALLVAEGYITGVNVWQAMDCEYPRVALVRPGITLKGLEYLSENSLMKKAANLAKGISELIP